MSAIGDTASVFLEFAFPRGRRREVQVVKGEHVEGRSP